MWQISTLRKFAPERQLSITSVPGRRVPPQPGGWVLAVVRASSRKGYLPFFEAALTAPALLEALVFF